MAEITLTRTAQISLELIPGKTYLTVTRPLFTQDPFALIVKTYDHAYNNRYEILPNEWGALKTYSDIIDTAISYIVTST